MSSGAYDVLSEHQHIRRMVDLLEASVERRDQIESGWLSDLTSVLSELSTGLGAHFKGEEAELFLDVKRRLPRQLSTIERLIEQHQHLAADFSELAAQVQTLTVAQVALIDEFVSKLSRTLKLLRTHEEQENELMLVAYWQDLGEA